MLLSLYRRPKVACTKDQSDGKSETAALNPEGALNLASTIAEKKSRKLASRGVSKDKMVASTSPGGTSMGSSVSPG